MTMTEKRRRKPRPFQRQALDGLAVPEMKPRMGPGETLWRYTVTVPLEEIKPQKRQKATAEDLVNLQEMFVDHFTGFTRPPNLPGCGLRDPNKPERMPEVNYNGYFAVLASPISEAEAHFRDLREEL
jgi:hypothetical protein